MQLKKPYCLKKSFLIVMLLSLTACNFLGDHSKAPEPMEETLKEQATQKVDAKAYVVQPNYDHPKFKELDAAFAKQKHRFEIDRCEFKYNDQSFFIGDSEQKVITALGEPELRHTETLDGESYALEYKKLKLLLWFQFKNNQVESFVLRMSDYDGHQNTPYKIVKFRKVPYHLDMTLNNFMELSDMNHTNVGHNSSVFNFINEKKCEGYNISTEIGSTPAYSNIGGGHMTIRGDFNPKSTGPIRSFITSLKQKN